LIYDKFLKIINELNITSNPIRTDTIKEHKRLPNKAGEAFVIISVIRYFSQIRKAN